MILFPSDILHSKQLSSVNIDSNSSSNAVLHLIICHKEDSSLYKSTRKISRTADRLVSSITAEDKVNTCNVYFVKGGKNKDSIHKRLKAEFGSCVDLHINVQDVRDIGAIRALRFSSTRRSSSDHSPSKDLSVVFLDFDDIYADANPTLYLELIEKILTSLSNEVAGDKSGYSLVHVKCSSLYKGVIDILSLDNANSQYCVMRKDLETHFCQSTAKQYGTIQQTSTVIRRLRQKKGAANCPLSIYSIRYIQHLNNNLVEICRFHNYDQDRGCLRSKRTRNNVNVIGCGMDHEHCHFCGEIGHRAFECAKRIQKQNVTPDLSLQPMVFSTIGGKIRLQSLTRYEQQQNVENTNRTLSLPSLVILGGRLRGKTLASCEILSLSKDADSENHWIKMPNLLEHRGSHAACSPVGTGLIFVMGGGGVDGNLDTVECFQLQGGSTHMDCASEKWQTMAGRLSSPRHAFGAVACTNNDASGAAIVHLFAVGGWKYGSVSCESVDTLSFEYHCNDLPTRQWKQCAPLLKPRRLHAVVSSADGSSIYVLGGYVDERFTTSSIEVYDVASNKWEARHELPFGDQTCPLVQAILDCSKSDNSFLIFPFGSEKGSSNDVEVLRYTPGSNSPFSTIPVPSKHEERGKSRTLYLPLKNWASFSVTSWSKGMKVYLVGGTLDGKWTSRVFELDLRSMKWTELSEMLCARRRAVALVIE